MPDQVVMSNEQFQQLLASLSVNFSNVQGANSPPVQSGNFSKCSSRFNGDKNSDVNAFIDAIEVYKDCTNISDENALKGFPMLLDNLAATWFQGVKSTLNTWKEAIDLLRVTFGPKKPPHSVYRELFAREQDSKTPTDIFVCKSRSILAMLPENTLTETTQLDMVYGLLHKRIREKVPRDGLKTFTDLLKEARCVEELFEENVPNEHKDISRRPRCAFCKNIGHTKEECRKLKQTRSVEQVSSKTNLPSSDQSNKSRPSTSRVVHSSSAQNTQAISSTLTCYGCGEPGYIRTNCPKCAKYVETNSLDFCSFGTKKMISINPRPRPYVQISILGLNGTGIIDTAAKQSVAGRSLYQALKAKGQTFEEDTVFVKLADGSGQNEHVLITRVDVILQGRIIPTCFVVLPNAENNNTLLGIDFIEDAKMVLDVSKRVWNFSDSSDQKYNLSFETLPTSCKSNLQVELYSFENIRADEGTMLTQEQKTRLGALLEANNHIFQLGGEATPYAEHHIDTGDHQPIAVPPYRMTSAKKEVLRADLDKVAITLTEARSVNEKHQDRQKMYADQRRIPSPVFCIGDKVWVATHTKSSTAKQVTSKLDPKRDGPYLIVKEVSPTSYQIATVDQPENPLGTYHVSLLTRVAGEEAEEAQPIVPIRRRGRPRKKKLNQPIPSVSSSGRTRKHRGRL